MQEYTHTKYNKKVKIVYYMLDRYEWIVRKQEMNKSIFITERSPEYANE